jgi:low affinity Fe/Cu permease
MSEQLRSGSENKTDTIDLGAEAEANLKRLKEVAEKQAETSTETITNLESVARTEAISGKEVTIGEKEASQPTHSGVHRELKNVAYARSMERIRSNLSAPSRMLSKIVHNPAIDAVSNGLAKTATRPSGILGGSIAALIGSLGLVYFSSHYGIAYNYTVFLVLYIAGYLLAVIVEAIVRMLRSKN